MKRLALCIGNNEYQILPKLLCAVNDAVMIEEKLKELGFETILATNLDRSGLIQKIVEFTDRLENYDAGLLYYAGHGFQIEGDNILAPVELNTNLSDKEIRYNAFPLNELMELLNRWPDKIKVVILDACRERLGSRGGFETFAPISAPQGSLIAFATSPGKQSRENSTTGHGKYTETLIRYMQLPRVPIETVFKKTRETLAAQTNGEQIPWEHTSLVGEFYLNPDTIYDGVYYSSDALADNRFHFWRSSSVKEIVEDLKSYTWPVQEKAIQKLGSVDYEETGGNELFVLGRNIYQAADGKCFAAQRFIDDFEKNRRIPDQAKKHLLNGMAFEIYYNSDNQLRRNFKQGYYQSIIYLLEKPEFYASREFIASFLNQNERKLMYIPGQNELIDLTVAVISEEDGYHVKDVIYGGKSVFYSRGGSRTADLEWTKKCRCSVFEQDIAAALMALTDNLHIEYTDVNISRDSILWIPAEGFSLRLEPMEDQEDENPFF